MYRCTFSLTSAPHGDRSQCHILVVLPPGNSSGTHCAGGGVVFTAGLDYCEKSRPQRMSNPKSSLYTECHRSLLTLCSLW